MLIITAGAKYSRAPIEHYFGIYGHYNTSRNNTIVFDDVIRTLPFAILCYFSSIANMIRLLRAKLSNLTRLGRV
jgi:hypothetical protein